MNGERYESAGDIAPSQDSRSALVQRAASGDPQAFQEAVEANLPLVTHLAKRFLRPDVEFDDIFQSGCIGLMKAIRRFDSSYGAAFSTYAVPVILGEIRRHLRDAGQVHIARSIRERATAIAACEERFLAEHGRSPTFGELADSLGATREEIALSYGARRPAVSLDAPVPGMEDMTNADMIGVDGLRGLEESIVLRSVLRSLPDDDRLLIDLRYLQRLTQSETGERLGLTQVQVCRKEKKLLKHMRSVVETP